jgi:hypothetical protein
MSKCSASVCVCVCGREVSLLCVCVYRCVRLKELTIGTESVSENQNVSEDGISMVLSHCNQLCILNLIGLWHIRGMCALCEVTGTITVQITIRGTLWYEGSPRST